MEILGSKVGKLSSIYLGLLVSDLFKSNVHLELSGGKVYVVASLLETTIFVQE